jgi:hypothetical protein
MFLSLLCLHTVAVTSPLPGPGVPPVSMPSVRANNSTVMLAYGSGSITINNPKPFISIGGPGTFFDLDSTFKHAAIFGVCVTVVALIVTTRDAHDTLWSNIKVLWRKICGQK